MEMTDNHLEIIMDNLEIIMDNLEIGFSQNNSLSQKFTNLMKYISPENKRESRVFITHIFPNSYVKNFEIIDDYDIIDTINGKKIKNLGEFRKAVIQTKKIGKKQFITLTTEINNSIVLSVEELLQEEKTFSQTYKYSISPIYHHFNRTSKKKTKSQKKTKKNISKPKKGNKKSNKVTPALKKKSK